MTINLPKDVEHSIEAALLSGQFASADALITEIVRDCFRHYSKVFPGPKEPKPGLGSIGALRDDAELLDQAVEHATKARETQLASQPDLGAAPSGDPLIGCMRNDAELMDEIVADAYRQRREEVWRELDL
jgi:hypothetical protein